MGRSETARNAVFARWGARGREFESRRPDQKTRLSRQFLLSLSSFVEHLHGLGACSVTKKCLLEGSDASAITLRRDMRCIVLQLAKCETEPAANVSCCS